MLTLEFQRRSTRTLPVGELDDRDLLGNMALGLGGESGEVMDVIKKHLYQGHDLDVEKVAEELGDLLWYISNTCTILGLDLGCVMQKNIDKLKKRYPNGFSSVDSIGRAGVTDESL